MENDTKISQSMEDLMIARKSLIASLRIHLFTVPLLFFSFLFAGGSPNGSTGISHTPKYLVLISMACILLYVFISWGTFFGAVVAYFLRKFILVQKLLVVSNHNLFYLALCVPFLVLVISGLFFE